MSKSDALSAGEIFESFKFLALAWAMLLCFVLFVGILATLAALRLVPPDAQLLHLEGLVIDASDRSYTRAGNVVHRTAIVIAPAASRKRYLETGRCDDGRHAFGYEYFGKTVRISLWNATPVEIVIDGRSCLSLARRRALRVDGAARAKARLPWLIALIVVTTALVGWGVRRQMKSVG